MRVVQAYAAVLGTAGPSSFAAVHRVPARGRNLHQGRGCLDLLYRAVDSLGQTIDFLLSAQRDSGSAKQFFRKALVQPHTVNPRTITVDKNPASPRAAADMKRAGELWHSSRPRQRKYMNNIVAQDHRRIKRLVRPGFNFCGLETTRRTLTGYEVIAMNRK